MNLSKSHYGLIPPLYALLKEKHVTRAAEQLNLSQSSMSKLFAQLKTAFNDELLVRSGKSYELTSRGESLLWALEELMPIAERLWMKPTLDLAGEQRIINIAGTDMDIDFISARLDAVMSKATRASVAVTTSGEYSLTALKNAELDFLLTAFDTNEQYLMREPLIRSDYVVVTKPGLVKGKLDLDSYLALEHVAFQLSNAKKTAVDIYLERQQLTRKIVLWTTTFHHCMKMVANTSRDFALTIPRVFAERIRQVEDLDIHPLPLALPDLQVYLYWHRKSDKDPFLSWVKDRLLGRDELTADDKK